MQNRQLTTALACVRLEAHKSLCITTMVFRSRKWTHDSHTLSISSSRTSRNGALYRRSSTETIQSYKGSISNSSTHTTSTAATRKDLIDCSEQGPGGVPSISDRKSLYSLEKPRFRDRNQSQSTVGTIRDAGSVRNSTATSTLEREIRSLNMPAFEDEDESPLPPTPRSSIYNLSTLPEPSSPSSNRIYGVPPSTPLDDPLTRFYGDSQPFAITEIPTADNTPARHPSSLPPSTDRMGPTLLSHTVPSTKEVMSSVSGTVTNHTSSPFSPSSRRTPKTTDEYVRSLKSLRECIESIKNAGNYAAASEDPFVPPTQAPPPPSSHDTSKPSRSRLKATSSVHPTPPCPPRANAVNLTDLYVNPNPNPDHGSAPTVLLEPREPYDDSQSFVTATSATSSTTSLSTVAVTSFSPPLARKRTLSRSRRASRGSLVTNKGKKGILGFMTDFLNLSKRPEISTAYDPVHLTHIGFDSSTRKYIGFPKEWQQLLQDSKSNQERRRLAAMEIFSLFSGGDVWDEMGHDPVQGISPPPPIPGAAPAAYPGAPKSVNASAEESPDSSNVDDVARPQATVVANGPVAGRWVPQPTAPQQQSAAIASLAKTAGTTPRRREKKREDKANDADLFKRLQQICTDADPTRLYRNLVKIGQG